MRGVASEAMVGVGVMDTWGGGLVWSGDGGRGEGGGGRDEGLARGHVIAEIGPASAPLPRLLSSVGVSS